MSTSTPITEVKSKVHFSEYMKTNNEGTDEVKPADNAEKGDKVQPATS
jgi:hypothetical protein